MQSDREARRQAIKLKSEQRTATWPNTLEAMRKKKDRWKKDKEERLEEERKKIDEEEMRLQREAQTKQIERANRLLYEQTDRMKTLRSKQLLADVVHVSAMFDFLSQHLYTWANPYSGHDSTARFSWRRSKCSKIKTI